MEQLQVQKKRGRPKGAKNKKTLTMMKQRDEGKIVKECSSQIDEILLLKRLEFPYLVQSIKRNLKRDQEWIVYAGIQVGKNDQEVITKCYDQIAKLTQSYRLQAQTGIIGCNLLTEFIQSKHVFFLGSQREDSITKKKVPATSTSSNTTISFGSLDEPTMEYYSKVCFFIAAKFNEVRWPMIQDVILGYQEQTYLQKEHEILQAVNFKIPQSNHVFYLSILFEIFEITKKQQETVTNDLFHLMT